MNSLSATLRVQLQADDIFDEEEFTVPSAAVVSREDWSELVSRWYDIGLTSAPAGASWQNDVELFISRLEETNRLVFASIERQDHFGAANDQLAGAQLPLGISQSFVPSAALIRCWIANASRFVGDPEAVVNSRTSDASVEFSKMFKKLLGSFAQEKRYSGERTVVIANRQGEFDAFFQLDVSERFLLLPQKSGEFFDLLYRDLLECGPKIQSAAWGSFVRRTDRTLLLELSPPEKIKREGFVKANEART